MAYFQARTDLALEAREYVENSKKEIRGVEVEEYDCEENIHVTQVKITTPNGARIMGKPKGTYITLEVPELCQGGEASEVTDNHEKIAFQISKQLIQLLPKDK